MALGERLFFVLLFISCCGAGIRGNPARLFSPNPPDFVNVPELRSSIESLLGGLRNRLRCDEHGLKHEECVQCLDTDRIVDLLKLNPHSKSFSKENAEDLSIFLAHQILYFEPMCIALSKGCSNVQECQEEVFEAMGRYSTLSESLVKILRIFKLYLREDEDRQCFSAEEIIEVLPSGDVNTVKSIRQMFAIIMGRLLKGKCIDVGESVTDFLDDIFHHYGDSCSPYMSLDGLKRMIHDLQNGQGSEHNHDHHHAHHHDNLHEDVHECDHKHGHFAHYGAHDHDHQDHDHHHHYPHYEHFHHGHNDSEAEHAHGPHEHAEHNHTDMERHVVHNHMIGMNPAHLHIPEIAHETVSLPGTVSESSDESSTAAFARTITGVFVGSNGTETTFTFMTSDATTPTSMDESSTSTSNNDSTSTMVTSVDLESMKEEDALMIPVSPASIGRIRRTTFKGREFNGPSASLRSDLSHQEERHRSDEYDLPPAVDDVKKVYLLQSDDNHRYFDLEPSGAPHQFASLAAKCLSAEEIIHKFGHQSNSTLTKSDFLDLCPALIQQIVSGVCTDSTAAAQSPMPSGTETYGYGSLSVFIISLTSLAGVLLLPIMTKHAYNYIIAGFYGLAFSTLAADAMLHLMPQFLGLHSHGPTNDHDHSHEGGVFEDYAQLQLGVFVTIYGLFLFESIMSAISGTSHSHGHGSPEIKDNGHSHGHLRDELPTLISVKTKSETQLVSMTVSRDQSNSSLDTEIVEVEPMKKPPNLMVSKPVFLGLTSLAIVVTLGDSLHNFGDGLAIGAAFSTGIRGGLSTSIAVFCHELPHEFGDFVILLSTGLSYSKALWINFLSGLTCFVGLYIGILIGDNEVARKWVMAVTAGIFLYVALGEMLPELREHRHGSRWKMLLVKNLGILSGLAIMLLISIYEQQLA